MKEFVIPLLGTIFVLLLVDYTESVVADHLEPGDGIFNSENEVNIILDKDSKFKIHIMVEVRNADGQLISVSENTSGFLIPHKITDHVFDNLMSEEGFVTIDNIKYEQAKYSGIPDNIINWQYVIPIYNIPSHFVGAWVMTLCGEIDTHGYTCITPFQANTAAVSVVEDDVVENHWMVLRIIN